MKYALEMGSSAMIYIPSIIKIGTGIKKMKGGTHRRYGGLISLSSFLFKNKESRLTMARLYEDMPLSNGTMQVSHGC
jgi:hypothetical protein